MVRRAVAALPVPTRTHDPRGRAGSTDRAARRLSEDRHNYITRYVVDKAAPIRYRDGMPTATTDLTTDPTAARFVDALAALGHEARLAIYRLLVRAGDEGLAVHQVQERVGGMPRSTLAHHLQALVRAGLVVQRKTGAEVVNVAAFDHMRALIGYLTEACCVDMCVVPIEDVQGVSMGTDR